MDSQSIGQIIKEISETELIEKAALPDVDLYMDQILTFFDDKLKDFKRNPDEKLLTKTMINNYSKNELLPPSYKKKYSKKHMMLLVLIYHMKAIISMSDIKEILGHIKDEEIADIYNYFVDTQREEFAELAQPSAPSEIPDILFAIKLINEANTRRRIAEKIIDGLVRPSAT